MSSNMSPNKMQISLPLSFRTQWFHCLEKNVERPKGRKDILMPMISMIVNKVSMMERIHFEVDTKVL